MSNKLNKLTTKRFVIRQSLIGTNTVITFVTKKGKSVIKIDSIQWIVSRNTNHILIVITFQHSVDNMSLCHDNTTMTICQWQRVMVVYYLTISIN